MAYVKKDKFSFEEFEKFLADNKIDAKLTGFNEFWEKAEKAPRKQAGLFRVSLSVVWTAVSSAVIVAVVIAAVLVMPAWGRKDGSLMLTSASGQNVLIKAKNASSWNTARQADRMLPGDSLKTGEGSGAELRFGKIVKMKIYPSAEMRLDSLTTAYRKSDTVFRLISGKAAFQYKNPGSGQTFRVKTSSVEVRAVGTRFMVAMDSGQNCRVSVSQGAVAITPVEQVVGEAVAQGLLTKEAGQDYIDKLNAVIRLESPGSVTLDKKTMDRFSSECREVFRQSRGNDSKTADPEAVEKINGIWSRLAGTIAVVRADFDRDMKELAEVFAGETDNGPVYRTVWNRELNENLPEKKIAALNDGRFCFTSGRFLYIFPVSGEPVSRIAVCDEGTMLTAPAVDGGRIVVGSDSGGLYAYDADGKQLWSNKNAGIEMFNAMPVFGGERIAVPTVDKGVQIFDRKGNAVASIQTGKKEAVYSSPLFLKNGSAILFGNEEGTLVCYDLSRSKTLWSTNYHRDILVYPLAGDDSVAVALSRTGGVLTAVSPVDGSFIWKKAVPQAEKTKVFPVIVGKQVLVCGGKTLLAFDTFKGTPLFTKEFQKEITGIICDGPWAFVADGGGGIFRLDIRTGKTQKVYQTDPGDNRITTVGGGLLIFTGRAVIKIAKTGQES